MKFKKIANILLLLFFVAFSILFCLNKFSKIALIDGNNKNIQIYELWHIESFEGGGANRQNYLNQIALNYEKQNSSILFMVKHIEADQLENALKQNTPHMISFSEQVAKIVLPYLKEFNNEHSIQNNFIESATHNRKLMALPFIASGYCYFTKDNSKDNLNLYTANNNLHTASNIVKAQEINEGNTLSSYQCYTEFVNRNNVKLLGTARDLFRIKNLENLGRFSINYEPVSTFTDLIQYIGKTSNDKNVDKFINFLINDSNQRKLVDLNLFSTKHLKLYTEPTYSLMEECLRMCHVPNIFTN